MIKICVLLYNLFFFGKGREEKKKKFKEKRVRERERERVKSVREKEEEFFFVLEKASKEKSSEGKEDFSFTLSWLFEDKPELEYFDFFLR